MTLQQFNRPFYEYWATFQRYAPKTKYNTKGKISFLMTGLLVELQKQTIHHDIPEKFNEYMTLLQTLDHKNCTMQKYICQPGGFTALFQFRSAPRKSFCPIQLILLNLNNKMLATLWIYLCNVNPCFCPNLRLINVV